MENTETPKVGLYFMTAKNAPACFAQAQKTFSAVTTLDFNPNLSLDDIQFEIKSGKKCLAILTIAERNDLAAIVNALFGFKKELRERRLIVVVFLKFASEKVDDLLMRSGCSEILKFDINTKAFTHKMNRYIKILEQETVNDDLVSLLSDKGEAQTGSKKLDAARESGPSPFQVHMIKAWEGGDDFWLFRKKVYAKKYRSFWLIEMIGPSPAAGSWEKIDDLTWQWQARATFPFFDTIPARWEFKGKRPQYSWTINRWGFVSETPTMSLVKEKEVVYSRFKLRDENNLEVADNSEYARSIFQKIKDTYDAEYMLKAEKIEGGEMRGVLGPDDEIPWADKTDSKTLSAADWNIHETKTEKPREINSGEFTDFLTGSEALKSCGLKGTLKNYPVDILEYSEAQSTITVGLNPALVDYKELIEITVNPENLDLPADIILKGVVTQIEPSGDEVGNTTAVVLMLQNSNKEFNQILFAINKRQLEVLAFFKRAKGTD